LLQLESFGSCDSVSCLNVADFNGVQTGPSFGKAGEASAVSYGEHFGEILGTRAKPLPVPPALGSVMLRAVSIAPTFALRIVPLDFVYYDRFQQGLAMANIARLLNPGGVFLCNSVLPAQHSDQLAYLGRRTVTFSEARAYGDDVVVYQKR
jgi:hypothetical protein